MPDINVPDRALRAIRRIIRKTSEYSRQVKRETGLSVPQALCLRAIGEAAEDQEVTVAQVSHAVQLAPATVSRILDRMERAEFIERQRRSKDRRKVCLVLTPLGQERLRNLPAPLQEAFVRRLLELPTCEQTDLLRSLETVVELMEASGLDAAPVLDAHADIKSAIE